VEQDPGSGFVALAGKRGTFRSLPVEGLPWSGKLVFGSCQEGADTSGVFTQINTEAPEGFIQLGDRHYGDLAVADVAQHRAALDSAHATASFSTALRGRWSIYQRDNHDTVGADGWSGATGMAESNTVYDQCVPVPSDLPAAAVSSGGKYYSFVLGRVRVILLDWYRERNNPANTDNSSKFMISQTQEDWLLDEITDTPEEVRLILYSGVWHQGTGADRWGEFTTQFKRIMAAIEAAGKAPSTIVLGGDFHGLAMTNGEWLPVNIGTPGVTRGLPNFIGAAFDQGSEGGSVLTWDAQRVNPAGVGQYGVLNVTDTGEQISIGYRGMGTDQPGVPVMSMTLTFGTITGSVGQAIMTWLGARVAGATMSDRQLAYFKSVSGIPLGSIADHMHAYYAAELGLSGTQAAARSLTDLELAYWEQEDPTNNTGSWADRARRFYSA
jgi:hypothetical protein